MIERSLDIGAHSKLFYTVDEFADPWNEVDTVVFVHGLAESAAAWYAWVPHFARNYRVVRLDLRGFGRSTPMPLDFAWTLDILASDVAKLIDELGAGSVHLVGAKIGAAIATHLAAIKPQLVKTLTLIGLPVVGPKRRIGCDPAEHGVLAWARSTMKDRLGASAAPEMLEWWAHLMARTELSTLLGFARDVGSFDVTADLPLIKCPVLVLSSDSPLHPVSEADSWRPTLPDSEMVVIPGEGFHAAAVQPDVCAETVSAFISRRGPRGHQESQ